MQAYIDGDGATGIIADSMSLTAHDTPHIHSVAVGASVAVGIAPAGVGGALSIGISLADNQISDDVEAYIKNANDHVTARTGDVSIEARVLEDRSKASHRYDATPGTKLVTIGDRVAVAPGYTHGGEAGGVYRLISTGSALPSVSLNLGSEDFTNTLRWTRDGSITAVSVAASLAIGAGDLVGVGISGAGAESTNIILTHTDAGIDTSTVITKGAGNGAGTGNVALDAENSSSIIATIVGASAAVGVGTVGVGVSIGAAVAHNFIGYNGDGSAATNEVRAYVKDSSIDATGDLTQTALADGTINAVVVAASAAVAGGLIGVAGGGAGAAATNKISTDVEASIDGDGATGLFADNLILQAHDNSHIKADLDAISLALALAPVGASVSVAVALADNTIGNFVKTYITNANTNVDARNGGIQLDAEEAETIDAHLLVISISGGLVAFSGGGAKATNTTATAISAFIGSSPTFTPTVASIVNAENDIKLSAMDTSSIAADLPTSSVAIGIVAAAAAVTVSENTINNTVDADITGATVKSTNGGIAMKAVSDQTVNAHTLTIAVGVGIGVATAVADAKSIINGHTQAFVGSQGQLTASNGDVSVTSSSTANATANMQGGSGSAVAVSVLRIGGSFTGPA